MNASTTLARAVLGDLVRSGIEELVLCPGSRSAPLAFAAARLVDAGVLRLHVRIDERSAGFLALGLAKVSQRPVAVVCTSGTAVANLMPAVVEASYAAVPLIVLSADRPVETRGVGAPQTIDQVAIFGEHVRLFADLGAPASPMEAVEQARPAVRVALRAAAGIGRPGQGVPHPGPVHLSGIPHPGPVHLNMGFRLPLVPDPEDLHDALSPEDPLRTHPPDLTPLPADAAADAEPLEQPPRGMIVVGDLPGTRDDPIHQAILDLAAGNGWPIIAEPTANVHGANVHGQDIVLGHGVLVLGTAWAEHHVPDLVLTVGSFGLSRPTLALVRRARKHVAIELAAVGREVCDPARSATRTLAAIPAPQPAAQPDPEWLAGWLAVDRLAAEAVQATLTASSDPLTGGLVAREVYRSAPTQGLLLLAASWPVRQVEALGGRRTGLRVIGNRGANGIDGLVSTAWGAALSHQRAGGGRAIALLGDIAFLHDQNGLLAGPVEDSPDLTIVIIDNNGGGIFAQLEQGRPEYAEHFDRLFATPQGRDLVAMAKAGGVPAVRVGSLTGLREALAASPRGVDVIVADVPGFTGDLALLRAVESALDARLASR